MSLTLQSLCNLLYSLFQSQSYGATLEKYIISRNPKNPSDIERYTTEFHMRHNGITWL